HRLDQVRALTVADALGGRTHDGIDGQRVGAVDAHAGEAVAGRAVGDAAGDLLAQRYGDGPMVVLAEKEHGRAEDTGEVHGLVAVTGGSGAVAEAHQHSDALAVEGAAHGEAYGVRNLRADRDDPWSEVVLERVPGGVCEATVPCQ